MVATPCQLEQTRTETEHKDRPKRVELGVPGSAAAPLPVALAPSFIGVPDAKDVGFGWTKTQCETWDIVVAAMWRGLR